MQETTPTKAIVATVGSALFAFLSSLLTAVQGTSTGLGTVTLSQWLTAAIAALVGSGIVGSATYQARNKVKAPH